MTIARNQHRFRTRGQRCWPGLIVGDLFPRPRRTPPNRKVWKDCPHEFGRERTLRDGIGYKIGQGMLRICPHCGAALYSCWTVGDDRYRLVGPDQVDHLADIYDLEADPCLPL